MNRGAFVRLHADWIRLVEAAHAPGGDDASWTAEVTEAVKAVFPNSVAILMYVVEHGPEGEALRVGGVDSTQTKSLFEEMNARIHAHLPELAPAVFRAFHYPRSPVGTQRTLLRRFGPEVEASFDSFLSGFNFADSLGIVSHPAPGVVAVLSAVSDRPIVLGPNERAVLTRVALHLDTAHRARRAAASIQAELTEDGRIVHREERALSATTLEGQAARIREARSLRRRGSADAIELWSALLAGRSSLIPRTDGRRSGYLVLDNPPALHGFRSLTDSESAILALASRGLSTKMIGYGLGVSSSSVSSRLASAAAKIGVMSRTELVRVAALLTRDPRASLPDVQLTAAEREILDCLQRGMSNREIAAERSRSVRTIANQVAGLLRKTGTSTRRALAASFSGYSAESL